MPEVTQKPAVQKVLEGRPIGHPLHPALVHLPLGLFYFSGLLDILNALGRPENARVRAAAYALGGGLAGALAAAVAGFADWLGIRRDHPAKKIATLHMLLNLTAVILYAQNLRLRLPAMRRSLAPWKAQRLSLLGAGLLAISGYLGGLLIYDHGIGVGRHRRRTPAPRATRHASAAEAQEGFVPVAAAEDLGEGTTLRAEVEGQVMALARVDGAVYAFQEFCTHRYGPLSEGVLDGHNLVCPWHRSCFDVRTGRVTGGPAKVNLKTYEVAVREGQICVRVPVNRSLQAEELRGGDEALKAERQVPGT